MHLLLDSLQENITGGPHWTFGSILKIAIGIFDEKDHHKIIQQQSNTFFNYCSFEEIIKIYSQIIYINNLDVNRCMLFWQLNSYTYDKEKFNKIINKINNNLSYLKTL